MNIKKILCAISLAFTVSLLGTVSSNAGTLDDVKARGVLKCGINTGLAGFAYTDDSGNWRGFDVAYCQALSAAISVLEIKWST